MNEDSYKHLIVAVGGIGLCYTGQIIGTWFIATSKELITLPFTIASVILTIAGLCCCVGAMLCQLDRYKKK